MSIFFNATTKPARYPFYLLETSHVVFGAPNRTCSGNGICKVYNIHAAARLNIPCELVQVKLALTRTHLVLCIPLANCSQQLIKQQFTNTGFIMEEDFPLPGKHTRIIQKVRAWVPAGEYAYVQRHGHIWMKLPLAAV